MADDINSFKKRISRGLFGAATVGLVGIGIATIVASGGAALPIVVGAILCCGGAAAGYLGKKITEVPTPEETQTKNTFAEHENSESLSRSASQEITIEKGAEGPSTKTNPEVQKRTGIEATKKVDQMRSKSFGNIQGLKSLNQSAAMVRSQSVSSLKSR